MAEVKKDFYTPKELANMLNVSLPTVYSWIRNGKLSVRYTNQVVRTKLLKRPRIHIAHEVVERLLKGEDLNGSSESSTACVVNEEEKLTPQHCEQ